MTHDAGRSDHASSTGIAGTRADAGCAGYDEARKTFNGTIDKRPAVIVPCRSTDDVVAAVRSARAAGLPIAVRGGGHGVAGHAVADGALVVDLREMRHVEVDPERREPGRPAAPSGWTSIAPRSSTPWRRPAARSLTPGSAA